ncbi:MAG: hypothetical protein G3H99_03355 [Ferrovum sp.]|nr:hypothetical protein [Ferrovum sp.]NDU88078.1 hypothetical protein [Ferrovum sp.]
MQSIPVVRTTSSPAPTKVAKGGVPSQGDSFMALLSEQMGAPSSNSMSVPSGTAVSSRPSSQGQGGSLQGSAGTAASLPSSQGQGGSLQASVGTAEQSVPSSGNQATSASTPSTGTVSTADSTAKKGGGASATVSLAQGAATGNPVILALNGAVKPESSGALTAGNSSVSDKKPLPVAPDSQSMAWVQGGMWMMMASAGGIPSGAAAPSNVSSSSLASAASGGSGGSLDAVPAPGLSGVAGGASGTSSATTDLTAQDTTGSAATSFSAFLNSSAPSSPTLSAPLTLSAESVHRNLLANDGTSVSQAVNPGALPLSLQNLSPNAPLAMTTPLGKDPWATEMAQKVTWMVSQSQQTAELQINPPDLGPLKIVVQVTGAQANAFFTSPHAAVRDAVQQALPQLRDMLANSGLSLGQATVSDQGSGARSGSQGQNPGSHNLSAVNRVLEVSSGQQALGAPMRISGLGLIDTFV